jgi:hypothetical protein
MDLLSNEYYFHSGKDGVVSWWPVIPSTRKPMSIEVGIKETKIQEKGYNHP